MRQLAFASAFLTVTACQTVTPNLEPNASKASDSAHDLEADSQSALQPIPEEEFEPLQHDYCEDNIYARYLEQRYLETAKGQLRGSRNSRQRRLAEQNLRQDLRHYLNQRIEGPHPPYFGALPVVESPRVQFWLDYFQNRGRTAFLTWLIRSQSVEQLVRPILQQEGLPPEVFFMAMIESGFSNMAYSRARATGT